jgi:alpha-beta hydrolase superfamily lysophospholipase
MSHEPWDETRNAWPDAQYIAAMHPGVGAALADWLDSVASRARQDSSGEWIGADLHHALTVARAINHTATPSV